MVKLITATIIQMVTFGAFYYLDAWATVEPWPRVRNFVLPAALFYGPAAIILWLTYRTIYEHFHRDFWIGNLFSSALLATIHIIASYFGSKQMPTKNQMIALALSLCAAIISGIEI